MELVNRNIICYNRGKNNTNINNKNNHINNNNIYKV